MNRSILLFFFFAVVAFLFIGRLFYIQVIDDRYKVYASSNVVRKEKVYAPRGSIYDRNGRLLVANLPAYDLNVIPSKTTSFDTLELSKVLEEPIEKIRKRLKRARRYSPYKPSVVIGQIEATAYAGLQEYMHKLPGFYVQKRLQRNYPYVGAPNVVGYIGEVTENYVRQHPAYEMGDLHGVSGIEKAYENDLRGRSGVRYLMVDVHNRAKGSFKNGQYDTLAVPGKDLTSTIDIDLQLLGEELMVNKRGSIVAIQPSTGEILALVTSPTFDPNRLVGRQRSREYNKLYVDSLNKPLFDRALLAEYPPGSPFKLINALIGLEEGVITPRSSFTCHHGFHYRSLHVACHCGTNSPIQLRTSISKSCNNYYCQVFKRIIENYPTAQEGMDAWSNHVRSFGLGNFLNNDLPTGRRGLVPDANYYNDAFGYTQWKAVSTISLGIGQGELVLTPIQMANVAAAISNRGFYYTPHIIKKIGDEVNEEFVDQKLTSVSPEHFEVVIDGMYEVFEKGTARLSRHDSITMCGKTGTAENPHGQDHSIFIAFAPKEDPQIAISIIVENGYWGSRWAAPIASLMMESYITGDISRPELKVKMLEGDLTEEYERDFFSSNQVKEE